MSTDATLWTIQAKGRNIDMSTSRHPAEARTLGVFRALCDVGPPGKYTLLAGTTVLATADVKKHEMAFDWRRPWIFYALGMAQRSTEVQAAEDFLSGEGA